MVKTNKLKKRKDKKRDAGPAEEKGITFMVNGEPLWLAGSLYG
jgi:hypothetical protein